MKRLLVVLLLVTGCATTDGVKCHQPFAGNLWLCDDAQGYRWSEVRQDDGTVMRDPILSPPYTVTP